MRPVSAFARLLGLALAAGGPLLISLPAAGQGDDMARAREAFSRGQDLFDGENYERALEAFDESLSAFPHFRTIFNIGLCLENLGDIAAAVEMYQRYVDWPAEVPNREDVGAKIEQLRRLLPPEPEPAAEPGPAVDTGEPAEPAAPLPATEPGPDLRLPGWIAVGAGTAGLVSGGVLLGLAQKRASEISGIEKVPYDPEVHDQLQLEGSRFEIAGWVTAGVGVAFVAAGLVMLLASGSGEGDPAADGASVSGFAAPVAGGAAWGVRGRF